MYSQKIVHKKFYNSNEIMIFESLMQINDSEYDSAIYMII